MKIVVLAQGHAVFNRALVPAMFPLEVKREVARVPANHVDSVRQ